MGGRRADGWREAKVTKQALGGEEAELRMGGKQQVERSQSWHGTVVDRCTCLKVKLEKVGGELGFSSPQYPVDLHLFFHNEIGGQGHRKQS